MSARESIIPVFVPHLGCPHNCVFCNQNRISGQLEPATPQTVIDEIENAAAFLPKGGKRQLAFYGGSFTAIPAAEQEALLGAAKTYLDRGEINAIRLSTRPDAIDETVLERLHRYGVETVELGAQSMDAQVLRRSARGHTAEDVEHASKLIKASGFRLILQMMTGLPGDTAEKDIETARKIIALEPDGVRIYPTVIVRDTALYDMWRAGKYREHTVEDAVSVCAQLVPLFEAAGIPIIRLGLNPTDDLSGGDAAGGAYHPALGELAYHAAEGAGTAGRHHDGQHRDACRRQGQSLADGGAAPLQHQSADGGIRPEKHQNNRKDGAFRARNSNTRH